MGHLLIDHTAGQGLDGKRGKRQEFGTAACIHCGRIIAYLMQSKAEPLALANCDIGLASLVAKDMSANYVGKCRCHRCNAAICRICAAAMHHSGGECPGPFEAHLEHAMKTGRWDYRHEYGQTV